MVSDSLGNFRRLLLRVRLEQKQHSDAIFLCLLMSRILCVCSVKCFLVSPLFRNRSGVCLPSIRPGVSAALGAALRRFRSAPLGSGRSVAQNGRSGFGLEGPRAGGSAAPRRGLGGRSLHDGRSGKHRGPAEPARGRRGVRRQAVNVSVKVTVHVIVC